VHKTDSNIHEVIAGWNTRIMIWRKYIKSAMGTAAEETIFGWVKKYFNGRPGLRMQTGKAASSWRHKESIGAKQLKTVIYSRIPGRSFNYIRAHMDPQTRHTAFGKPSKPWKLKQRVKLHEDWQADDGRRFFGNVQDVMASKGLI